MALDSTTIAPTNAGQNVDTQKDLLNQTVQGLISRATAPQNHMQAPQPRFSPESMQRQGYNMNVGTGPNKKAARTQDFGIAMQNFGTLIHNMVGQHKQNQVREAMADWQSFDNSLQKAQMAAGDPSSPDYQKKVQQNLANMPWVKSMLDPANPKSVKRLKNMYKALNVDLLDDKENVYGQALKQYHKVKNAEGKIQDAQQRMEMDKKRQQTMQSRIVQMMQQSQQTPPDAQRLEEAANIMERRKQLDLEEKRMGLDKYDFKQGTGADGKPQWFAFDKTNPTKVVSLEVDGKPIAPAFKPSANQGKVLTIEGKPYGVIGEGGKTISPESPEWQDPKNSDLHHSWDSANKAYATAEANKQKLAGIRASTYMQSREYGVYDTQTGQLVEVGPAVINANPGRYAPVSGAIGALTKEAVFSDIDYNVNNVREAAKNLKHGFDAKTRAALILSMRSTDPANSVSTFISSAIAGSLTSDQIQFVTALASLQENAQSLRSVAGMGAGSDMLREAILRTVPGMGAPSAQFVDRQLDLFQGTAKRLQSGVPIVAKPGDDRTPPSATIIKDKKDLD